MGVDTADGLPRGVHRDLTALVEIVAARDRDSRMPEGGAVEALYQDWYLRGAEWRAQGDAATVAVALPGGQRDLTGALHAAHAGATEFSRGWVVLAAQPRGMLVVGRADRQRTANAGEYASLLRPAVPPAPGEEVAVVRRIDHVDSATGWWASTSELGDPEGDLGRFYLHPRAADAPAIVASLTAELLEQAFPWSVKAAVDAESYWRADSLVVYIPRKDQAAALRCLAVASKRVAGLLRGLPRLTRPVSPVLAYADDPGGRHSYGTVVCHALASGVADLQSGGLRGEPAVAVLAGALQSAGIDPGRPWLESRAQRWVST